MKTPLVSIQDIFKNFSYPKPISILKGISLSIYPEESLVITGPSGSGKSTLLQILATLETPTSGSISFQGNPLLPHLLPKVRNQHYGFVFQSGNLLEEYTLLENLLLKAKIARRATHKKSSAYKEALCLIERLDLTDRIDFPLKYLSGGEKQRVAIAIALVNDPDLILADEPTGNLDKRSSEKVQNILLNCCKTLTKALVVVTHDQNFVNLFERRLHLHEGKLLDLSSFPSNKKHSISLK